MESTLLINLTNQKQLILNFYIQNPKLIELILNKE